MKHQTPMNLSIHPTTAIFLSPAYKPPKSKQQHSSSKKPLTKQKNKIKRSVKVLIVNCRSIVDNKKEYDNVIHSTKPDVVIGKT